MGKLANLAPRHILVSADGGMVYAATRTDNKIAQFKVAVRGKILQATAHLCGQTSSILLILTGSCETLAWR